MTSRPETVLTVCPYCQQPIGEREREFIQRGETERERQLRANVERGFSLRLEVERKDVEEKAAKRYEQELSLVERARRSVEEELRATKGAFTELEQNQQRVVSEAVKAERENIKRQAAHEYEQKMLDAKQQLEEAEQARGRVQEELEGANQRAARAEEEFEARLEDRLTQERKKAEEQAQGIAKEAQRAQRQAEDELATTKERIAKSEDQWRKQIEELKAKLERKEAIESGAVQEDRLVQLLQNEFPRDRIELVGTRGGPDIKHQVVEGGEPCGLIIYESKRVRSWQNAWIEKLIQEKVNAGAEYAVLVSIAFPAGEENFCVKSGVPVVHPTHLIPFVTILRGALAAIKLHSQSMEEAEYKYQSLVSFLQGPQFRQRMIEIGRNMTLLDSLQQKEKRAHDKVWSQQTQIQRRTSQLGVEVQTEIAAILAGAVQVRLRETA